MKTRCSTWALIYFWFSSVVFVPRSFAKVGLNKMYSFTVIISSTNMYRKHKGSMLIGVLPVDKTIATQTFTMARWQIVVKTSKAPKLPFKQFQYSSDSQWRSPVTSMAQHYRSHKTQADKNNNIKKNPRTKKKLLLRVTWRILHLSSVHHLMKDRTAGRCCSRQMAVTTCSHPDTPPPPHAPPPPLHPR